MKYMTGVPVLSKKETILFFEFIKNELFVFLVVDGMHSKQR